MFQKPFRPPLLKRPLPANHDEEKHSSNNPEKSRRISGGSNVVRQPLVSRDNSTATHDHVKQPNDQDEKYYRVLWRKFTTKKHKTWDGDGILSLKGEIANLEDISGKELGKQKCRVAPVPGDILSIGGKDVEIVDVMAGREVMEGRTSMAPHPPISKAITSSTFKITTPKLEMKKEEQDRKMNIAAPRTSATNRAFKNPLLVDNVMSKIEGGGPVPRHDPKMPGAVVMKRPSVVPKGKQIVDVVVDPILGKHLREHQKEGVKFMYECVMGLRPFVGEGAILADEMGLGKSLQTIALLWTLLKQNPIAGADPVIKKAVIVCPVTLMDNWRREFKKWLGNERISVFVDDKKKRITDFTMGKSYNVLIIGYERLRKVQDDLLKGSGIDIIVADEGQRLKTAQNKSAMAIRSLNTSRRIVLSGTPFQNDMSEFFVVVDFVNPGLLGRYPEFKRYFEGPILKGRQPNASKEEIEKGQDRNDELASQTDLFILRRTAEDILSKYLPSKTEYVLFCQPTPVQTAIYRSVLSSSVFEAAFGNSELSLQLITTLKKACNSPALLRQQGEGQPASDRALSLSLPSSLLQNSPIQLSGKLATLDSLLRHLHVSNQEKIVLVSNYTTTLDLLAAHLASLGMSFLRLDGSTPSAKRAELVNSFNNSSPSKCFAFLLSAKSGGLGLNLIGASRLLLFEVDWNPSVDLQAMARIHRDGQKRDCKIYRLLLNGCLDEKIWQRQITKVGLSENVLDKKESVSGFSREELRDLFSIEERGEGCATHDLIDCTCTGLGEDLRMENALDQDDVEIKDDSFHSLPGLMKANEVDMVSQEQAIQQGNDTIKAKEKSKKMQCLKQYRHLDTRACMALSDEELAELIDDDILLLVLKEHRQQIPFIFSKNTSSERM